MTCQLHTTFSLCASQVRLLLSRSLYRSHVLTTFFGPCFRGHDEAGLLAFEALQGLPRGTGTRIYIIRLLGSLSNASRLLRMCQLKPSGLPRLLLDEPFRPASSEKSKSRGLPIEEKMPIEDIHLALAPNPRVLLGFCAPSSVVSVAGGWRVAAVGFVVVLQRYRSCGSWACPGGLVSGWTWCWGRIWGYLAGWIWSLKVLWLKASLSGVGRYLVPWGKVLAAAGSKSFMALVSRVTKETTCVEKSIAGSGTRAEPLQAAAQSVATGISTVLLWLADASLFSDVGPLETIAENKKEQKSAAKRRQRLLKAPQQLPS